MKTIFWGIVAAITLMLACEANQQCEVAPSAVDYTDTWSLIFLLLAAFAARFIIKKISTDEA